MFTPNQDQIAKVYDAAKERFAAYGVDTEQAMEEFSHIPISLHCWQGDDVKGFEELGDVESQNTVVGNHPGRARTPQELRQDIDAAFSFSPAKHRVNLHSCYAEPAGNRERSTYTYEDFAKWVAWAKEQGYGVDFNASFFTHPMMKDGFSLASKEKEVRDYWVRAGVNARAISEQIGKELGTPCYNNIWIPDGYKDLPANRFTYRGYLQESLDRIFEQKRDHGCVVDVLEGKLFSIGYECFTVGSHEFYLGYAAKNGVGVCLDTGHYHPTESVVDKLSSIYPFVPDLLLHVSRGVRWDSDHVLIQGDDLQNIMHEMHRGGLFGKVAIGLDYFDATINRVAAWSIGLRACSKAILTALLTPDHLLEQAEQQGDLTARLALTDEFQNLPYNAVWDMLCVKKGVPVGTAWVDAVLRYEQDVCLKR